MIDINKKSIYLVLTLCIVAVQQTFAQKQTTDQKVEALLAKMTLAEKIGQLNQYNGDWEATGPVTKDVGNKIDEIKQGRVGAVLNIMGTAHTKIFQDAAMQSRLKSPLLFGQDVIHGYDITFPIPLGAASRWDLDALEQIGRASCRESV
mgnify:CR=1 FL=1